MWWEKCSFPADHRPSKTAYDQHTLGVCGQNTQHAFYGLFMHASLKVDCFFWIISFPCVCPAGTFLVYIVWRDGACFFAPCRALPRPRGVIAWLWTGGSRKSLLFLCQVASCPINQWVWALIMVLSVYHKVIWWLLPVPDFSRCVEQFWE